MRIILRHLENLESDLLVVVFTLPNFGHESGALGMVSLLHNALEFV